MKRHIITFFSILFVSVGISYADFVEEAQVKNIAQRWFSSTDFSIELSADRTLYYVNSGSGEGWLIVSAEDSTTPVIAYSYTGSINPGSLPSNAKAWIEASYDKPVQEARLKQLKATEEVRKMWKSAGVRTKAASGKLLSTANWDQDEPYNLYCPTVKENGRNVRALTGCVATSMAIIVRYHQWPQRGIGSTEKYSFKSLDRVTVNMPSIDLSEHEYDYSLMPLNYTSTAGTSQKQAVSRLMADLGSAAKLEYGYAEGTGGYPSDIANALIKNFGYKECATELYRSAYTDAEWLAILKGEIDANRPVLYGGYSNESGGHQYVVDGYDISGYVHVNWGWSGEANGYFTFMMEIPGDYHFELGSSIVAYLEPDRDGSNTGNIQGGPLMLYDYNGNSSGVTLSSGSLNDKSFTLKIQGISNLDEYNDYVGKARAAVIDYRGEFKEAISNENNYTIEKGSIDVKGFSLSCTAGNYSIGDRVTVQFLDKDGEWRAVYPDSENSKGSHYIAVWDTPYIITEPHYSTGDNFVLHLIHGNSLISSYTWTIDGKTQSHISSAPLTSGKHTVEVKVKLANRENYTIKRVITVE